MQLVSSHTSYHRGLHISSLHVLERNFHAGYKWVVANDHDKWSNLRDKSQICARIESHLQ